MIGKLAQTVIFDVSNHGFGHLAQVAPVVQRMTSLFPDLRVVLRSAHPEYIIRDFTGPSIELGEPPPEAALVSRGPTIIDAAASATAYDDLHRHWDEHLDRATERLAALAPRVLVADVPYLSLAAAERLGIPSIALCSINWLDLYRAYCGPAYDHSIVQTIKAAYGSAKFFLQPCPHMPMLDLSNRRSIGPIARIGQARKQELRRMLGVTRDERIVLVTFGGISSKRPLRLPRLPGVRWLLGSRQPAEADTATEASRVDMGFIDLLASCDCVVTKVGYGTFVESACNGVGLVSPARADWPESNALIEWARQHATFALVEDGIENAQGLQIAVSTVLDSVRRPPAAPSGIREAIDVIADIAGLRPTQNG